MKVKISQLPDATSFTPEDLFLIVDKETLITQKVTLQQIIDKTVETLDLTGSSLTTGSATIEVFPDGTIQLTGSTYFSGTQHQITGNLSINGILQVSEKIISLGDLNVSGNTIVAEISGTTAKYTIITGSFANFQNLSVGSVLVNNNNISGINELTASNISSSNIVGNFSGNGSAITDIATSNITNFTNDVRAQFSAGTGITINNGQVSASNSITNIAAGTNLTGGGNNGNINVSLTSSITGGLDNLTGLTNLYSNIISASILSASSFVGLPNFVGGQDKQVQFNSGSQVSGSENLTYDYVAGILSGTIFRSITAEFATVSGSTITGGLALFTEITAANISGTSANFTQVNSKFVGDGNQLTNITTSSLVHKTITIGTTSVSLNETILQIQGLNNLTASTAFFQGDIRINGTASIAHLNTVEQTSLVVGDKYIVVMSGGVDHTGLDGAGMLWGSGSTGPTVDEHGANAHIVYRNNYDKLEIYPGLYVSGALTASSLISGTNAYFNQVSAKFIGDGNELTNITTSSLVHKTITIGATPINLNEATLVLQGLNELSASAISASQYIGLPNFITSPGGQNTQIQFNDNNNFSGSSNLTFDKNNNALSGIVAQFIEISSSAISSSNFIGNGNSLTNLTSSNIQNFTNDVRGQFSAGTGITINFGEISASNSITDIVAGTNLIGGGNNGNVTISLTSSITSGLDNLTGLTNLYSTVVSGNTVSASQYVGLPNFVTSPGGENAQIQFNSGSTFSGSNNLTYDYVNNVLSGTVITGTIARFTNLTASKIDVRTLNVNGDATFNNSIYTTFNTRIYANNVAYLNDGVIVNGELAVNTGQVSIYVPSYFEDNVEFYKNVTIGDSQSDKLSVSSSANFLAPITASIISSSNYYGNGNGLTNISTSSLVQKSITIGNTTIGLGETKTIIAGITELTATNAFFSGDVRINGTASISMLNTINQTSLVVGDKYIVVMSGGIDHTTLDGSGLLWGSGSTGPTVDSQGANAHVIYSNSYDKLEIYPGLYVSGALTASSEISGTNAYFDQVNAKFVGDGSSVANITASNISNFTADVRNQISAGTGITVNNGVISASNSITNITAGSNLVGGGNSGDVNISLTSSITSGLDNLTGLTNLQSTFITGTNVLATTLNGTAANYINLTGTNITGTTARFTTLSSSGINNVGEIYTSNNIFNSGNLYVSGNAVITGTVLAANGSAATVSYAFVGSADTGLYRAAVNVPAISTNGIEATRWVYQTSGAQTQLASLNAAAGGNESTPSLTWQLDNNTGLFRPDADTIGISTGATEKVRITDVGNFGIGDKAPSEKLVVSGNIKATGTGIVSGTTAQFTNTTSSILILNDTLSYNSTATNSGAIYIKQKNQNSNAGFVTENSTSTQKIRIYYGSGGKQVFDTDPADDYRLGPASTGASYAEIVAGRRIIFSSFNNSNAGGFLFRISSSAGYRDVFKLEDNTGNAIVSGNLSVTGAATFNDGVRTSGSVARKVTKISSATTLDSTNHIVFASASVAFTVTLPAITADLVGREYIIKKIDSNSEVITVSASSTDRIDGATTYPLNAQYESVTLICGEFATTSSWYIV